MTYAMPGWLALVLIGQALVTALNTWIITHQKSSAVSAEQRRNERLEKRLAFANFMRTARFMHTFISTEVREAQLAGKRTTYSSLHSTTDKTTFDAHRVDYNDAHHEVLFLVDRKGAEALAGLERQLLPQMDDTPMALPASWEELIGDVREALQRSLNASEWR